jgi:hypothetical protein
MPSAAVLLLCIALQGCATRLDPASYTSPVPEDVRRSVRTVAVISTVAAADHTAPRLVVPIGQGKGAAEGAATGAAVGVLSGVLVSIAGGPLGAVLAPVIIPAFTLGSTAGSAAVGWSISVPAKDAEAANAALARSRFDLSAEVARRTASRLPAAGKAAAPADGTGSPDLRIEVSVDRWGLAGGAGSDPLTGFYVAASYRVAKASDNKTLVERRFVEAGAQRPVSEWTRDDAALLTRAVDAALSRVAEAIADGTFLVHDFRILEGGGGPVRDVVCGLRPISPPPIYRFGPFEFDPSRVDSLTPRLVWSAFPSRDEVQGDAGRVLARVSETRYDLRIWKGENSGRENSSTNGRAGAGGEERRRRAHFETPLVAGSSYLWSARALASMQRSASRGGRTTGNRDRRDSHGVLRPAPLVGRAECAVLPGECRAPAPASSIPFRRCSISSSAPVDSCGRAMSAARRAALVVPPRGEIWNSVGGGGAGSVRLASGAMDCVVMPIRLAYLWPQRQRFDGQAHRQRPTSLRLLRHLSGPRPGPPGFRPHSDLVAAPPRIRWGLLAWQPDAVRLDDQYRHEDEYGQLHRATNHCPSSVRGWL